MNPYLVYSINKTLLQGKKYLHQFSWKGAYAHGFLEWKN